MGFIENNKHLEIQIKEMLAVNNDWLYMQFGEAKLIIRDVKQNAEAIVFWIEKKGIKISNCFSVTNEKNKLVTCTIGESFEYSLEIKKVEHASKAISYLKGLSSRIDYLLEDNVKEEKERNEDSRQLLINVMKKFLETTSIDDVLKEIFHTLFHLYPQAHAELYLSGGWDVRRVHERVKVKNELTSVDKEMNECFLTGKSAHTSNAGEQMLIFPFNGKQGTYGVMSIYFHSGILLAEKEKEFIQVLTDAGGNAMENTEAALQSERLIWELQLVNAASNSLQRHMHLETVIKEMENLFFDSFGADHAAFIIYDKNDREQIFESKKYWASPGKSAERKKMIERASQTDTSWFSGDIRKENGQKSDYLSVICLPLKDGEKIFGAVIVSGKKSWHFTYNQYKLMQTIVHHCSLVVTNVLLHERLEQLVRTDELTSLSSRRYLENYLREHLAQYPNGVFFLFDIDDFKRINDTYGHDTGDDTIVQVSSVIKRYSRREDVAARWGGEELVLFLKDAEADTAVKVAERIIRRVHEETSPKVTVSCGIASVKQVAFGNGYKDLFRRADRALYKAKQSGKNQIVFDDDESKSRAGLS